MAFVIPFASREGLVMTVEIWLQRRLSGLRAQTTVALDMEVGSGCVAAQGGEEVEGQ